MAYLPFSEVPDDALFRAEIMHAGGDELVICKKVAGSKVLLTTGHHNGRYCFDHREADDFPLSDLVQYPLLQVC